MSDTANQDAPVDGFGQDSAPLSNNRNPEDLAAARAHGWMEDEKLDYDAFNAATSESKPTWASSARVYEWDGEQGDIGPPDDELEQQLFGGEQTRAGTSLEHIMNFEAKVEGPKKFDPIGDVSLPLFRSNDM